MKPMALQLCLNMDVLLLWLIHYCKQSKSKILEIMVNYYQEMKLKDGAYEINN